MEKDNLLKIEDLDRILQQYADTLYNINQQNNYYGISAKELLPYRNSPYLSKIRDLYDNEMEFFTENEKSKIVSILQIIKDDLSPFALITGNPASGKSVLAYRIAAEFENCGKDYKAYYYTCREGVSPSDLINELVFYDQMNQGTRKLYIIDDIHLSPERIFYFFSRVKSENIRCAILFVSRMIEKDYGGEKSVEAGIYEELESTTYQLEFSIYPTNDIVDQSIKEKEKSNLRSMNKIRGIVQKFSEKNNLRMPTNETVDSLFNKTGFDLLNLFYYLSAWKEVASNNPNIELYLIDERDVLKHVYAENLSHKTPKDREIIVKYACMYQYEAWFEVEFDDYYLIYCLLQDGIIVRDNKIYSFYHSKFAELLIKSYIYCDEFFEIKYQNLADLVIENISSYIKGYLYNRTRKYPNNIFELFDGMLGERNRYLHNSIKDNSIIFNSLLKDDEIKNIVLSFFYNSDIEAIKIKKFMNYTFKYANEHYLDIQTRLMFKDDFKWLKQRLVNVSSTDNFLAFILFINDYEDIYKIFSDKEIKELIKTGSNSLKYLYGIKNIEIREYVKSLLSEEEWFLLFKNYSVDKIKDTLIDIDGNDNEFAIYLLTQFSDKDLIEKIKENFVIGLAHIIPILQKLDNERTKLLISKFDNEYIIKNLMGYIKKHNEEGNLQIVSDFIQQISVVDKDKASTLLSYIDFNEIYLLLNSFGLPQIVSFFSELKEINDEIADLLFNGIDYEFLCNKIVLEPANKVLNSISEIRRLNEETARSLMHFIKETLIKTIPEIKLETFVSYEKNGMIVMEPLVTSEIMGRLPDEYIRNYKNLEDMRDIIRLISLYRYVDFGLWDKEYLLNEIFEYVDINFVKRYLHKKWLPSTMRLLTVCSLYGRRIRSVGNDVSKAVFRDILLAKGNLGHFAKNIAIIRKHNQELAEELELELSSQLNIINNQMKGVGLFMDTILIAILKFLGTSVGSGVTWDLLKNGSSKIVDNFKKKFVEERYFDNDEKCERFFQELCENRSYDPEEPFDDVKKFYKMYAKGKQYEVFENALTEWLKENGSDMVKNNDDTLVKAQFYKSKVKQKAKKIVNIDTQNNYNESQDKQH